MTVMMTHSKFNRNFTRKGLYLNDEDQRLIESVMIASAKVRRCGWLYVRWLPDHCCLLCHCRPEGKYKTDDLV